MECPSTCPAGLDEVLQNSSVMGDDLYHGGSYGPQGLFNRGVILKEDVNGMWGEMHRARWVAESGIERMKQVLGHDVRAFRPRRSSEHLRRLCEPASRRARVRCGLRRRTCAGFHGPLRARGFPVHGGAPHRGERHASRGTRLAASGSVRRARLGAGLARAMDRGCRRRAASADELRLRGALLDEHAGREQRSGVRDEQSPRVHGLQHAVGAGLPGSARPVGHGEDVVRRRPGGPGRPHALLPTAQVQRARRRRPFDQGHRNVDAAR